MRGKHEKSGNHDKAETIAKVTTLVLVLINNILQMLCYIKTLAE
jgi:hypothetical protein